MRTIYLVSRKHVLSSPCSYISSKKLHNSKERCISKWSHWPSVKLQMVLWSHKAYNQLHSYQNFSEVYFTKGTFKLVSKSFQKEYCFLPIVNNESSSTCEATKCYLCHLEWKLCWLNSIFKTLYPCEMGIIDILWASKVSFRNVIN